MEQYANEKPFVEMELQEGEDALFALQEAKRLVEEFHALNVRQEEEKRVIKVDKPISSSMEYNISICKTIEQLKEWEIMANSKGREALKAAYEEKLKELQNGN